MNTTVFVFYFLSSLLWKRIWTQNLLIDSKPADRPKSPTSFFIFNCLQHIKSYILVFTKVYLHVALCIYIYIPLPVSIHRTSVLYFFDLTNVLPLDLVHGDMPQDETGSRLSSSMRAIGLHTWHWVPFLLGTRVYSHQRIRRELH